MDAEEYEAELERIARLSDPGERRNQLARLADRRDRARQREFLASMDNATERLARVAAGLEADTDSRRRTLEEMERLRDEMARLALVMQRRRGEIEAETSGERQAVGGRQTDTLAAVPGWVVKALLSLLALSLAGGLGVAGVKIGGSLLPYSVEPASSGTGEESSPP